MNIMYLCDNNYAMVLGISILSLLESNKVAGTINIFLVNDNISDENINKISKLVDQYNRKLYIIEKPNFKTLLGCKVEMQCWVENVFSKVFLGEVFKNYKEVHRIIFIDSDTLVVGSLEDLWKLDLESYIGAGVCEAMGNIHKRVIGLSKKDNYYNAGMLLIDLDKWKNKDIDLKASEYVHRYRRKLEYTDESVLNGILSRDLKRISPQYNLTSLSIYFTPDELKTYRKSYINYSEKELQEALSEAKIIHFTATFLDVRPWVVGCKHPYAQKWLEYKEKSFWSDEPMMKDSRSKIKRLVRSIALIIPKRIRIPIAGIMHAYIKPIKYIIR